MLVQISTQEDLEGIRKLYEDAFHDQKSFVDYYFKEVYKPDCVAVIKEDERIVAMMHLNPFEVNFNGQMVPTSYFVAVATDLSYRNKGYMAKLMAFSLRKLYEDGETFSLLMPIDSRIYERYGFGFIEDNLHLEGKLETFTCEFVSDYTYKIATEDDFSELARLYDVFSKTIDLTAKRDEAAFRRLYLELLTDEVQLILFDEGYMMTFFTDEMLTVREFVANSDRAFKEMMTYLKEHTLNGKVVIYDHIKSRVKYCLPNIDGNNIVLKPFMMARILNVAVFMARNKELFMEGVAIKVTDGFIEENNRVFKLVGGEVVITETQEYDVMLDIKTLTQLVFGYIGEEEILLLNEVNDVNSRKPILTKKLGIHFFNEYV
ncbi:MAG: GNAT family N-acetyltransferase [Vallitaleaceae bacterium]|nr:GNAT family N-acetyltransferase [Vallitaleaceae bacterium]